MRRTCISQRHRVYFNPGGTFSPKVQFGDPVRISNQHQYITNYRSSDPATYLGAEIQQRGQVKSEKQRKRLRRHGVSEEAYRRLADGAAPRSEGEDEVAQNLDIRGFLSDQENGGKLPATSFESHFRENEQHMKYLNRMKKWQGTPSYFSYRKAMHGLFQEEQNLRTIGYLRDKLELETGITAEQRLDAYMMGDESIFPAWAKEIALDIRDRVLYGGIGITEYDEVIRTRLLRLPTDQRIEKWNSMKSRRRSIDGTERIITAKERRDVALCRRKHRWGLRLATERLVHLQTIQQRNPDNGMWPVDSPDTSAQISVTASYVQAGVPTGGTWPLDEETASRALERKKEKESMSQFVTKSQVIGVGVEPDARFSRSLKTLANAADSPQRVKRVSRWTYQKRWSAILHGYKDEHGRPLREAVKIGRKYQAYQSFAEMESSKERMWIPRPWRAPEYRNITASWCPVYKMEKWTFSAGKPKLKYYSL